MPSPRSSDRIPTNLITGFLGVGKTTAILDLARRRPADERWAVLVNEYGEVGLDQAIFEGGGDQQLFISEIAGGCFCCASGLPLELTLPELIRQARPQRLLIEPTGLGHPARVLDQLRGLQFRDVLDIRTTIAIADPRDFLNPRIGQSAVFLDQLQLADVVVINKTDVVEPTVVEQFQNWCRDLYPPKLLISTTQQAKLDPAWLDQPCDEIREPLFPDAHPLRDDLKAVPKVHQLQIVSGSEASAATASPMARPARAELGNPLRFPGLAEVSDSQGWIFTAEDVFRKDALLDLLGGGFSIRRIKGVFQVEDDWIVFNRVGWEMSVQQTAYRRDSRLEVILDHASRRWKELDYELLNCLVKS
jgi:G3E family GTPase